MGKQLNSILRIRLKIVKSIAKTSVEKSQDKNKTRFDKKAEAPKFRRGDYVLYSQ